jgi:hypothetical protein
MAAITDKRGPKKLTSKRSHQLATARPVLDITQAATDHSSGNTPPTVTAAAWEEQQKTNGWYMLCAEKQAMQVGTPRTHEETARAEQERLQEQLLRGVWSHGECGGCEGDTEVAAHAMPLLTDSNTEEDEAPASRQSDRSMPLKGAAPVQDGDDFMASVLGNMSEVTDLDEMSDVSDLGWPAIPHQVPLIDALIDEAEIRSNTHTEAKEVDEVEWLRRTYETVYNPTARQRALDQLLSTCGSVKRQADASYKPARANKSTVLYDFV